jgi:glycosyltransferase involved in cell wall biosynthesis
MKKVLIVFSHPAPYKVHFFNELSKHVDLTVVFERELGSYAKKQYQNTPPYLFKTIDIGGIPFGKENHVSIRLIHHLKTHSYDAIIMNGYSSLTEIVTIRYLKRSNTPYILYVNGGVIRKESSLKYRFKRSLIQHAYAYFSPSIHVDPYLVHYGARPEHIFHYPYATIFEDDIAERIPTEHDKRRLREHHNLPHQHLTISVGQFIQRKNFETLLAFWRTQPPSYHLVLIGDGPRLKAYERYIKRHHMRHVTIKPFQPKQALLECYQASDAFILLSKEDIYGHVINEALSQGLPVMTTYQTISGKTLLTDETGVLVDVHQPATFQAHYETLLLKHKPGSSLSLARQSTFETMLRVHLEHFKQLGLV